MTTPQESLRPEHNQIRLILRMLDTQLNRLRAGGTADYNVLSGAVAFLAEFLTDVHHPREEQMLAILVERVPELTLAVELIVEEHRLCEDHAKRLLEAVQRDTAKPGLLFAELLADLIDRQRMFMTLEEKTIFTKMHRVLAERDTGFQGCAA